MVRLSRRVVRGASGRWSAERRARRFLEPHPRRKAGGAPAGAGAGARAGAGGGAARLPGPRASTAVGGEGRGTEGDARSAAPARSAPRRCGRGGRGESNQQLGAALSSIALAATLPARSPGRYVLLAPFHRWWKQRPGKNRLAQVHTENLGQSQLPSTRVADSCCHLSLNLSRKEQSQGSTWVALHVGSTHLPVSEPDSLAGKWEDSPNITQAADFQQVCDLRQSTNTLSLSFYLC